jgi:hypothetical protein
LERDSPAARPEITLLDPNWLTGAVYLILEQAKSVDQAGEFLHHQLSEWLDPGPYPLERHEFILGMMQDEDIGLCFRLPAPREKRYLVPEALPANRPTFVPAWPEDSLRFRYVYKYLPPGLIPRFIVQSNQNLTPEKARWRTGVVLKASGCRVLVLADLDKKRVDIQVDGPGNLRRSALSVILNYLEFVHKLNPEAEPEGVVPLPDQPEVYESYDHLLMMEEKEGSAFQFYPTGAKRKYAVGELLESVRRDALNDPIHGISQRGAAVFINPTFAQGSFAMGDIFSNIANSTIVNRSLVERSFNKVKSEADEETAKVLLEIAKVVADSGNKEAGEILDQFNEELAKPEPRKTLLKRSWDGLVQVLPTVTTVAGAAGAIAKLFG